MRGLLGDKFQLEDELSPARRVDERTSPTFIWATASDPPGLPNALEWARVLGENQIPMELHIYPEGRRGIGLADGVVYGSHGDDAIPHTAQWSRSAGRWLRHTEIVARSR